MIEILKETVVFNGIDEKTIKNILEKNNIKIDDKNINMEDLVRLVYENIS